MNIKSEFTNEESNEKIVEENEEEKRIELKRKRNRDRQRAYYHRQKELKKNEKKIKKKVPKTNAERQREFRQRRAESFPDMFPLNPNKRDQWRQAVRRERRDPGWKETAFSKICSLHFREDELYRSARGNRMLQKDAVPICTMVFAPAPEDTSYTVPQSPQHAEEVNNVPVMMIKVDPLNLNKDLTTDEASKPKRRRQDSPEGFSAVDLQSSITELNALLTREKTKDDCDIYGNLLATKLRKYSDRDRLKIMYEIDGLLLSRPPTHFNADNEYFNGPNDTIEDTHQLTSSCYNQQTSHEGCSKAAPNDDEETPAAPQIKVEFIDIETKDISDIVKVEYED